MSVWLLSEYLYRCVSLPTQTYGESGTGKTRLMFGDAGEVGVVPRALHQLFLLRRRFDLILSLRVVDVCGNVITDLLPSPRLRSLGVDELLVATSVLHHTPVNEVLLNSRTFAMTLLMEALQSRRRGAATFSSSASVSGASSSGGWAGGGGGGGSGSVTSGGGGGGGRGGAGGGGGGGEGGGGGSGGGSGASNSSHVVVMVRAERRPVRRSAVLFLCDIAGTQSVDTDVVGKEGLKSSIHVNANLVRWCSGCVPAVSLCPVNLACPASTHFIAFIKAVVVSLLLLLWWWWWWWR
jgi:hypothetical protein